MSTGCVVFNSTCGVNILIWWPRNRSGINGKFVMPRPQPAVRATALACLVQRRSYVSNSASPAVDWGLKVILQPPYRQRTSLAAAVPPTHRIACRKSHSEGTFNVLAPCLRGTFNVRFPCHRPRVRGAVCVSVPQWHGAGAFKAPLMCVARTDISSLPRVYGEQITGIPKKIFNLTKHGENTSVNIMVPPATGIAPVAFGGRGTAQKQPYHGPDY